MRRLILAFVVLLAILLSIGWLGLSRMARVKELTAHDQTLRDLLAEMFAAQGGEPISRIILPTQLRSAMCLP